MQFGHESPTTRRPPAIVDVVSASGVVLITLQRIMDGALREYLPGAAVTHESLLTLRRDDGAAMAFVRKEDSTRTVQALGYEPGGRLLLGQWTESSSPDPLYEYAAFRARVLDLLNADPLGMLSKPICELLLEPRWFNGVGNYLRGRFCIGRGCRRLNPRRWCSRGRTRGRTARRHRRR